FSSPISCWLSWPSNSSIRFCLNATAGKRVSQSLHRIFARDSLSRFAACTKAKRRLDGFFRSRSPHAARVGGDRELRKARANCLVRAGDHQRRTENDARGFARGGDGGDRTGAQ